MNKKEIIKQAIKYHTENQEKHLFPCVLDYAQLIDSKKTICISGSDSEDRTAFLVLDDMPQLTGLEYPVIKYLTVFGNNWKKPLLNHLKLIGDTFFIIVESYNQAALNFIKSLNYEETYFCQEKMICELDSMSCDAGLSDNFSIRNFEPGHDEKCYVELYNTCLGFLGSIVDEDFVREIEERPSFDPSGYFIAEKDGNSVGMLSIEQAPWGNDPAFGYIYQAGVVPEARGTGLASQLMQRAFLFAKQKGITHIGTGVRKSNSQALRFFQRMGFEIKYNTQGYLIHI